MTKTITMDYDEFIAIKEKADLNQAAIDKRVNKQVNKLDKQLREIYTAENQLDLDRIKRELAESLNKRIKGKKNIFGYIKYEDILGIFLRREYEKDINE